MLQLILGNQKKRKTIYHFKQGLLLFNGGFNPAPPFLKTYNMIEINKTSKDKVINALNRYPGSRDNDNLLACYIWKEELNTDINKLSVSAFFNKMSMGKLTAYETIRRIRAKLQSENPSLRGENYFKRANKDKEIQTNLFNL